MNDLQIGEIIQIKPDFKSKCFAGCFATVVGLKSFGCMCYVQGVGATFKESTGQYYLRLKFEDFETTGGFAQWIVGSEGSEEISG